MKRKRVYVAGSYSADNVLDVLKNMRIGIRASTQVFLWGFSPFSPWLDYQFSLCMREGEEQMLKVQDYYDYSMAWLEASDMVVVLPNSENSVGTNKEIARASEMGIPTYEWNDFVVMREALK